MRAQIRLVAALCWLSATVSVGVGCAPKHDALLVDRTASTGVDFVHRNGMRDQLWFAEMMGGGVATFDFDRDGDQDILFVQGQALDGPPDQGVLHRLYRNDSNASGLHFVDVSAQAGIASNSYAMGVAIGDVDNDGWPDVYITAFGANAMWRNEGNGQFTPLAGQADDARWSVSASFADLDGDGALDLYVGNYVDYRLANHKPCRSTTSARDYCSPTVYPPQADSLWQNSAASPPRFDDISRQAGIANAAGAALGVVVADFDGDHLPDIYVANDGSANALWHNEGAMRFADVAGLAGAAVNMGGAPEASMGVDAADFDGDGDFDLFMTHLSRESNTLYINDGRGYFDDRSAALGAGGSSLPYTGFGTRWADFDADGDLDLFAANGAVTRVQALIDAGDPYPLGQRNQFFRYTPDGYVDDSGRIDDGQHVAVSRGLAAADLDNDGAIDLVIANSNGAAQILHGAQPPAQWLGVNVVVAKQGRAAIGATVRLTSATATRVRRVHRDGSYASASDPRIVFAAPGTDFELQVTWRDGQTRRWRDLALNRYHTLAPEPVP